MQKHALCIREAVLCSERKQHARIVTKLLLVMRLTIFFLTAAFLNVSAHGLAQTIHFSGKNVPLQQVFTVVEKQTGYVFLYNEATLKEAHPVTIAADDLPLDVFLARVLSDQPLSYAIRSRTVIISKKNMPEPVKASTPVTVLAGDVEGKIIDEDGKPLAGANVAVKGTERGTTSEADGSFVLRNANEGDVLVITYLGHKPLELKVTRSNARITIVMRQAHDPLDEIHIIAYGSSTRRLALGNVTSIKSEEIQKQPVSNVLLALQGRVPGLQITPVNNSLPGQAPRLQVRGISSIGAGTSPLIILDGVPIPETLPSVNGIITQSGLITINPADVESMEVLKDAEATAIYGSRGANGVILITTKKGKAGKTTIDLNAWTGFGKVARQVPFMDVHQYNAMRREAFANDGITPTPLNAADLYAWDTVNVRNWQKELLGGTAVTNDINLSASGGDMNTRFLINGGYHKEGTVLPGNSGADRKTVRLTVDHNSPNGKLGIMGTTAFVNNTLNLPAADLTSSIALAPSYPLYKADGTPNYDGPGGFPLAYLHQPFNNTTTNYNGHVTLRYTPVKALNLKADMGFNDNHVNESQITPASSISSTQQSSVNMRTSDQKTWIIEPQADYTVHVKQHTLNLLVGGTWQKVTMNQLGAYGTGFTSDALLGNISSAASISTNSSQTLYTYNAFFSRLTYNWKQEYLVNVSFRRDGSSRFGPGKRFGNFGAAALGWIFTQNKFVKSALPFLSFGKLRTSYGLTGNDQINDYAYITTYGVGSASSSGGYQGASFTPANLANPNYHWEEDRKWEAALDLGFLQDRLLFNTSFFINRTNNQLIGFSLSPQAGFSSFIANFPALLQNKGWEFEVTSRNIVSKDFNWKTRLNFSLTQNKLLSFPNITQTAYSSQYFVGQPLTVRQAYQFTGLTNKGVPAFADLDKDNSITSKDRYIIGNGNPLYGSMMNEFEYKNFSLGFFIEYTHLNNFNNTIPAARIGGLNANALTMVLDRWQKPGDELYTSRPKFTTSTATYNARNFSQSDIYWSHYNIFRLRNANIAYNLPARLLKRKYVQHLRVYVLAQNLYVFDKNKYRLDPDTGNTGMPPLRIFTFGINCSL